MNKKIFAVILTFVLLFVAFHPSYLEPGAEFPTFDEMFDFGYEITVGTIEVAVSIFQGPSKFLTRFDKWRHAVFGDVTLLDFLDELTDRLPVIRTLKNFVEGVLEPLSDSFENISNWIKEHLVKE